MSDAYESGKTRCADLSQEFTAQDRSLIFEDSTCLRSSSTWYFAGRGPSGGGSGLASWSVASKISPSIFRRWVAVSGQRAAASKPGGRLLPAPHPGIGMNFRCFFVVVVNPEDLGRQHVAAKPTTRRWALASSSSGSVEYRSIQMY